MFVICSNPSARQRMPSFGSVCTQRTMSGERVAFNLYLRTGRRFAPSRIEVKFNPWHDEENGRFTYAGQGRYFGAGGRSAGLATTGSGKTRDDDAAPDRSRNRADHPNNHVIHIAQPGDPLSRIAARRQGLTARDLALARPAGPRSALAGWTTDQTAAPSLPGPLYGGAWRKPAAGPQQSAVAGKPDSRCKLEA